MKFSIKDRKFVEQDINSNEVAIVGADKTLTWYELELATKNYVRKLTSLGLGPGMTVGIIGHKETDFLAAICACITLGCPYIPIDEIYAQDRISKIFYIADIFCYIDVGRNLIETSFMRELIHEFPKADDLIYIMFTSGSTGDPKGVQISRESILSMLEWMHEDFHLPKNTIFMNQAPFSFDLSVYEVMYTLNFGHALVLNSRDQIKKNDFFLDRIRVNQVNAWVSTPSFAWSQLISEKFNSNYLDKIECFLFCGEILPVKLVKKLRQLFPNAKILNTYGPTEATVATTLIDITDKIISGYETLPIGYPKKGTQVYVDHEGQICIVGPNVMHGYLNRQDLNSSNMFMQDGMRGFKTGDLGFIKNDLLFCQGRKDDQIKLHGYRIELSEIDHAIAKFPAIKEAATIAIRRGEEVIRLVSFIKFEQLEKMEKLELEIFKMEMSKILPLYMIPAEFIIYEHFPMSNNHKVDKKKLLEIYKNEKLDKWS